MRLHLVGIETKKGDTTLPSQMSCRGLADSRTSCRQFEPFPKGNAKATKTKNPRFRRPLKGEAEAAGRLIWLGLPG